MDRSYRVSLVESALVTSPGRLARKAPKQLIVRGICRELFSTLAAALRCWTYSVEADAFESDFAHQFSCIYSLLAVVGGRAHQLM
jgi:hypothetical protein